MTTKNERKQIQRKRFWRSILTALAAIIVFVMTYALIIPAITWEQTMICELEEHIHTDDSNNAEGQLKCEKAEYKHTDVCLDAPSGNVQNQFKDGKPHQGPNPHLEPE